MAPRTIDYSNTYFYKICCKDLEITDIESRNPSPIPSEFDFKIEELPDLMN